MPMPIPVPVSDFPLAFDALPALKARHYYSEPAAPNIYTLARMYILGDSLRLSLSAFEREPGETSRIDFTLCGKGAPVLRLALTPAGARLFVGENEAPPPTAAFTGGADEQGWYWGADIALPAELLARAGCRLAPGTQFYASLFKTGGQTLGSAFPLASPHTPYDPACFGLFEAVPF